MTSEKTLRSRWVRSFFVRAIRPRYILTPLGTINITYPITRDSSIEYTDVYVFGIRIMRIQRS